MIKTNIVNFHSLELQYQLYDCQGKMIDIVQVFTYKNNSGFSIRIGRGFDQHEPLRQDQCKVFEFVPLDGSYISAAKIRYFRNLVRKLDRRHYRGKNQALCQLDGDGSGRSSSSAALAEFNHPANQIIKSAAGSWRW